MPAGKKISGTKEWAAHSRNVLLGCPHECRYCYARANALRFKQIASAADWGCARLLRGPAARPGRREHKERGVVMFPTCHDIVPEFLHPCLEKLRNLLVVGNQVLIVSKPHLSCVSVLCLRLEDWRDQILWRFTIGAMTDRILRYWEPGAPGFQERLDSLHQAYRLGYRTSVSAEPLLEYDRAVELFQRLEPFVSDTIWFGAMNKIRQRVGCDASPEEIARIERGQTPEAMRSLYDRLKNERKVRWKESYKTALGLAPAGEAGLDV